MVAFFFIHVLFCNVYFCVTRTTKEKTNISTCERFVNIITDSFILNHKLWRWNTQSANWLTIGSFNKFIYEFFCKIPNSLRKNTLIWAQMKFFQTHCATINYVTLSWLVLIAFGVWHRCLINECEVKTTESYYFESKSTICSIRVVDGDGCINICAQDFMITAILFIYRVIWELFPSRFVCTLFRAFSTEL